MKKIALCSLMMCLGVIGNGFAGNCTMSNKIGELRDSIIFGATGDQGLFCGASGAKTCNYSEFALINGRHSVVRSTNAWNAVEDFRVYKCVDIPWDPVDEWQKGHEAELQTCVKSKHAGYKEIGRDDGYVYLAKNRESHGSVVYAAGAKTGMCRIAISQYDPNDFCSDCNNSEPNEVGCKDAGGVVVPVGGKSQNNTCTGDLKKEGAETCTCVCLSNGSWQCDVDTCSDKKKTVNKNKRNTTGGLGVCEEKTTPARYCDKYKNYSKRYACCVAGKATKWKGNDMSNDGSCECVDKTMNWDGKKCVKKADTTCEGMYKGNDIAIACCNNSDSSWNSDLKKCECNEDNKDWKYDEKTKTGKCEETGDASVDTNCYYTINIDIKCANRNTYTKTETIQISEKEARKMSCAAWKQKVKQIESGTLLENTVTEIDELDALIKKVCKSDYVAPSLSDNSAEVAVAKKTLSAFFETTKQNRNVWRDKDGNFNTARLASDLTAGVVLGTVGGVVSGVVIKKKQVEKGFDALHCTVGGQTVADWGDTFTVGLR